MAERIKWKEVLPVAAAIVEQYNTNVTLRQLFYRLVAAHILPNTVNAYKELSRKSAEARREGWFPDLYDNTREIHRYYPTFDQPQKALDWLHKIYRRDRTEGQNYAIYLGVEKNTMVEQLRSWFQPWGLSILALGGYASQSYVKEIMNDALEDDRETVLLYAGDFDPSGVDILRDFAERTNCWDYIERVALNSDQITDYNLPPAPDKMSDSRAVGFMLEHGELIQVELEALAPEDLRDLYKNAILFYWDSEAYDASMAREDEDKSRLPVKVNDLLDETG